eukprot:gnl/TRDRNA2_/TRDRNA2_189561_c0_seq1.p1 gnl/TRDRNA2_/TRDRNA2_189561_c0~~gnl/TRDRNA2_/TRDRNA2_189561_c0_seq1.p1  ORF type:complete len:738 (+),score=172.14 gnl/TRDRNA2_/TRDRNA2_189561_c0_seq1:158-2371(+)
MAATASDEMEELDLPASPPVEPNDSPPMLPAPTKVPNSNSPPSTPQLAFTTNTQVKDEDALGGAKVKLVGTSLPQNGIDGGRQDPAFAEGKVESKWGQVKALMQLQAVAAQGVHEDVNDIKLHKDAIFPDAQELKDKVREAITKKQYNVFDYYSQSGLCQQIARDPWFESITLAVIFFNALWISIDTDHNDSKVLLEAEAHFQIMENFFCVYFSIEWFIRFGSFKNKLNGFRDAWFVFDGTLVLLMVGETWVVSAVILITGAGREGLGNSSSLVRLFRLLRLSRMARMVRLLRALPELMILIKGVVIAMRSVFFTLCLLLIIIYVFAIAFKQLTSEMVIGEAHFRTVPAAMYTLIIYGTLLDEISSVMNEVRDESPAIMFLFFIFILVSAWTVMNMLIGVLVEGVSAVAKIEKEQLVVNYVKLRLEQMLAEERLDNNDDGLISKTEFKKILENKKAARALQEVGVDVVGLVDFADFIFQQQLADSDDDDDDDHTQNKEMKLNFHNFMHIILQFRGSNTATVKDIVDLRKFVVQTLNRHEYRRTTRETKARGVSAMQGSIRAISSMKASATFRKHTFSRDSTDSMVKAGESLRATASNRDNSVSSPLPLRGVSFSSKFSKIARGARGAVSGTSPPSSKAAKPESEESREPSPSRPRCNLQTLLADDDEDTTKVRDALSTGMAEINTIRSGYEEERKLLKSRLQELEAKCSKLDLMEDSIHASLEQFQQAKQSRLKTTK